MKKRNWFYMMCIAAGLAACSPMDGVTSWTENCEVTLHWEASGSDSGQQPVTIDSLQVRFMPHTPETETEQFYMKGYDDCYDMPTNMYDLLVFHDERFLQNAGKLRTAVIEFPVEYNEQREPVITYTSDSILYVGHVDSVTVDYNKRMNIDIQMRRMMKKLNLRVYLGDDKALLENCTVNISGIAYRKNIWTRDCDEHANGIMVTQLQKEGRYLNNDVALTLYTGSFYCLGAVGQNIMYFSYVNGEGKTVDCKFDMTSYLYEWGHEDLTVTLRILNNNGELDVNGWDVGNEDNIIIEK